MTTPEELRADFIATPPDQSDDGAADAAGAQPEPGQISRHVLLRRAGLGVASVLVVGSGAATYRAYDAGVFSVEQGPAYAPWRTWADDPSVAGLVGAALLAPSPHNAQAWSYHVTPGRIDVSEDSSRRTGVTDPFGRELAVGLGAAIENLMLAAAARGHSADLTLIPDRTDPVRAATVEFATGRRRESALYAAIPHRHSNRYAFSSRPVAQAALDPMQRLATGLEPAQIVVLSDAGPVQRVGELVVAATTAMVADRVRARDDQRWMRQSWSQIQQLRDGITLDTAGLSDWLVALAKLLPAQSASTNDSAWLDGTRDRQVSSARAWGVVAVPDPTNPRQRLLGGRLLERAHLWATVNGLALQHMNAITERADRERQLGLAPHFGPAFAELMPGRGLIPLVTFRLGYPTHSPRQSPRRPVAWVRT